MRSTKQVIADAHYSMIGGNLDNEKIPTYIIETWLTDIRDSIIDDEIECNKHNSDQYHCPKCGARRGDLDMYSPEFQSHTVMTIDCKCNRCGCEFLIWFDVKVTEVVEWKSDANKTG